MQEGTLNAIKSRVIESLWFVLDYCSSNLLPQKNSRKNAGGINCVQSDIRKRYFQNINDSYIISCQVLTLVCNIRHCVMDRAVHKATRHWLDGLGFGP